MDKPHLRILRVKRSAVNIASAGPAQHQRGRSSPTVVCFRDHVDDLIEGAADEIHELKFGYRTHPRERSAERGSHNGRLRDWRVDHPLGTETVDESVGDFKGAAVDADILADAKNGRVAFHLLPNSLADGFEVGDDGHRLGSVARNSGRA